MNTENFVYWLQGFFELTNTEELTIAQTQIIKDHLKLVMHKITPDVVVQQTKLEDRIPSLSKLFENPYPGLHQTVTC